MKKTLLIAAALFTAVSPVMAGARLSGAGASFPSKIYTRWFADFSKEKDGHRVNYQAVGSGSGRNCLLYTSPSPRDGTRSRMPSSA